MVKKLERLFWVIIIILVLIDQTLKAIILKYQPHLNLKVFTIDFVQNTGAGFGILKGQTLFLAIISIVVAIIVIYYYYHNQFEKYPTILLATFTGGIIGNFLDRAIRNYVIDFIDFKFWPAFNFADACISLSVIGLIIFFWKEEE